RALDAEPMRQAVAHLAPDLDETQRDLLSALAEGAPGRALELAETGALDLYRDIAGVLKGLPRLNAPGLFALAEKLSRASVDRLAVFVSLLAQIEERVLRGAYTALPPVPGEDSLLNHLRTTVPLESWSRLWDELRLQAIRADALNLDKKQLVLNTFFAIEAAARR
ncbi:MAG: DNA polymerase III subunit delta', partial [Alphaproteobacteria bacterium]|nr:DNA polymerase III subunit delta' [Alphaproteobacteria bacterium]